MVTETAAAAGVATTITMPQLGESVTEGTIGTWLKGIGDRVEKYEPLVEVVTDKVNAEIPAPVGGVLVAILVEPDTTVPVGAGLCLIDESGGQDLAIHSGAPGSGTKSAARGDAESRAQPAAFPSQASTSSADPGTVMGLRRKGEIADEAALLRARSSPAVRRIAEEHGIELAQVPGTGIHGRVTKQDILAYLATAPTAPSVTDEAAADATVTEALQETAGAPPESVPTRDGLATWSPSPPAAPITPATPMAAAPAPIMPAAVGSQPPASSPQSVQPAPGDVVVPLTPMRRAIAEHMVRSERTAPHVTVVMEVDMTRVVAYRTAHKEAFRRREGIDLTYLPFAIKAATTALRDQPRLNAVWDEPGGRIVQRGAINVGVAVGLEDGLVVPVIKHADRLSLAGLMHAVAELAAKARSGTLAPDDVVGGTFTVNNPGTFGSLVSTPILVQPQAAILSTEAIVKRPVVIDDMIGIRSMMNLSLSIDHRVLDGLAAARFLQQVKAWLENVDEGLSLY